MITIKQIAELCGVSRGTVDRVINGRGNVKEEKRAQILKTMAEFGYRPNPAARALVSQKQCPVAGIVIAASEIQFFSPIITALRKAADYYGRFGLETQFHLLTGYSVREQCDAIAALRAAGAEALIINPINDSEVISALEEAIADGIFVVSLNNDFETRQPHIYVGCDYEAGGRTAAAAAWRGAFLARGSLTEPGRSSSLEVTCPGSEAALALVGAARRFDISAKAREVRGADRVVVRDGEAIGVLLERMGAPEAFKVWAERRSRRESRGTANRLANFDDANLRRSARAAVASGARVERAFEILGEDVPSHLAEAGRLRLEHKQASLEELGQYSDPPLTKDAVAGRIRRLLAMADKRAQELGVPDTESVLTQDMLDL